MRLFLAADLPDAFRRAVGLLRDRLEPLYPGWRWVDPRSMHLTLRFLGEVDPERDRAARPAWRTAAGGAGRFRFTAGSLGRFPPSGRPRLLWLGVRDEPTGAGAALAAELESAARRSGFAPEDRPFRGHLTLARARRDAPPHRPRRPAESEVPPELRGEVAEVTCAVLFRSDLRPDGPRYTALEEFPLSACGRLERERV